MKRISTYCKSLLLFGGILLGYNAQAQDWYELSNKDNVNYNEVVKAADAYFAIHGTGKGSGYKLYERWKYFAERLIDDNGNVISTSDIVKAKQKFDNTYSVKRANATFAGDWKEIGPFAYTHTSGWNPGLGRIVAIAVEKNNQQLMFAGSPGGGIWKTIDGGQNWIPKGDDFSNMSIWGIGIDPFNNDNIYAIDGAGRVIKSTNQGDSWSVIYNTGAGLSNPHSIVFHPTNQGTVLIASNSGVYKSTDDGANFTKVLNVSSIQDVMFNTADPSIVYACGTAFYKSTDTGNSFTQKSSGINSTERMKMAVTPANANYVYLIQKSGSAFGALYRSTNAGESFTTRNASNPPYLTQASRDMAIMVSSTNAEEVHCAGMNNHRSTDGGNSFTTLSTWSAATDPSYIHADVEVMMCVNDVFYAGTDGGVYRSSNHGDNYADLGSLGGLAVHQFYRIGGTPQDAKMMIGGSQDNGVNIMKNKSATWSQWLGADGMECFIDHSNSSILYGATQNGSLSKSTNGGATRFGISAPESDGNWVTPFEIDPINASTIYVGYTKLYRSNDGGTNWTNISSGVSSGKLDEVTIAESDNNYIYIADDSNLWRTTNGQAASPTWTSVSNFTGNVNYIAVDPNDPLRVAIACSGSRVYVSTDGGTNWTNKTMNLPSSGANCVIFDHESNNGIYVGTENAVYYTSDTETEWLPFSSGLPKTRVNEFYIHVPTKTLRVGTYGRGMWESGMYGSSLAPSITSLGDFIFCEGDSVELQATVANQTPGSHTYQWRKDGANLTGETGETYIASEQGDYTVVVSDGSAVGESNDFEVTVVEKPTTVVTVVPSCGPGIVDLMANGNLEVNWYSSLGASTADFTGLNYAPNLSSTTSLFVEARTVVLGGKVGEADNSVAIGGSHAGGFYLIFDVENAMKLKTAKVYATGTKDRTLELRDNNDNLIESKVINIVDGESVINIDLSIPVGLGYKIGFASGADLYRSNTGVSYPYAIADLVSINSSSAGSTPGNYYYYLYDWDVEQIYPLCIGERQQVEALVQTKPAAPNTVGYDGCEGENGPYLITAQNSEGGLLKWYETEISSTVLENGTDYSVTTPVATSKSYYVEEVVTSDKTVFGGIPNNTTATGGTHAGGFYLVFDATKDFILKSAKVYAEVTKDRTIELRDSFGNVLDSKIISVQAGESTIAIDMAISAGTNLQIGFPAGSDLYRSSLGVSYPYDIDGAISINTSTAGSTPENFYYYLYNWEVTFPGYECASERAEATITIDLCISTEENELANSLRVYPNPATATVFIKQLNARDFSSVRMIDAVGRVVYVNSSMVNSISVQNFAAGTYQLIFTSADNKTAVYNVVITK